MSANEPDTPAAAPLNLIFKDGFEPPTGLIISSSVAEALHRTSSQLITFTFDGDVSGFDTTDITLTGALAGAFTPVSDSVYTLAVTSLGGTVSVNVPFAAAIALSDGSSTGAASFSNFYQDTPQINLPGGVTLRLVRIPAGTFLMGSPEDELSRYERETQHQVTHSRDYYMGETEVTQEQWVALMGDVPEDQPQGLNDDLPVEFVSWDDIMEPSGFLETLNDHIVDTGQPFEVMLPSESQWEYAARAGTTTRFSFGDGFAADEDCATGGGREDHMWYCGNSGDVTQLVRQKLPNPWGLYDMHGNVLEWVADYFDSYPTEPIIDPTGPETGSERVFRGGAAALRANESRSAARDSTVSSRQFIGSGFRIAASRPAMIGISSNRADPHQETTQQISFTLSGGGFSSFDGEQIDVTGASKGDFGPFNPPSPIFYILQLENTGGLVTVDIPAGAAIPFPPYTTSAPATFSNFHQDVWTIELPELDGEVVTMDFIRIPPGSFMQGAPDNETGAFSQEKTQFEATISEEFYMSRTEVTQDQWESARSIGQEPAFGVAQTYVGGSKPVHNVSHDDIHQGYTSPDSGFMERLDGIVRDASSNAWTAKLPTESQWEYAARAGTTTRFSFGDGFSTNDLCDTGGDRETHMWYCGNSGSALQDVGLKLPNPWGLYDMHGNVNEWTDTFFYFYDFPDLPPPDAYATRGGSFGSQAKACRSAFRDQTATTFRNAGLGLRVVLVRD